MKAIFFAVLALSQGNVSYSAEEPGIECKAIEGPKDALGLEFISYGMELVRLRFRGAVPDRYFSHTGKGIYTQFATRKDTISPLENKIEGKSTLEVEHRYGGVVFTWTNRRSKTKYQCENAFQSK